MFFVIYFVKILNNVRSHSRYQIICWMNFYENNALRLQLNTKIHPPHLSPHTHRHTVGGLSPPVCKQGPHWRGPLLAPSPLTRLAVGEMRVAPGRRHSQPGARNASPTSAASASHTGPSTGPQTWRLSRLHSYGCSAQSTLPLFFLAYTSLDFNLPFYVFILLLY